jgi:hypothetical protein
MTALQTLRARARAELGVTLRRRPDGAYALLRGPGAPGDLIARDADELRAVLGRWLEEPSPADRRQFDLPLDPDLVGTVSGRPS